MAGLLAADMHPALSAGMPEAVPAKATAKPKLHQPLVARTLCLSDQVCPVFSLFRVAAFGCNTEGWTLWSTLSIASSSAMDTQAMRSRRHEQMTRSSGCLLL